MKTTRTTITLDEETAEKLKEITEKKHTNVSQWVTDRVWEAVEREEDRQRLAIFAEKGIVPQINTDNMYDFSKTIADSGNISREVPHRGPGRPKGSKNKKDTQ